MQHIDANALSRLIIGLVLSIAGIAMLAFGRAASLRPQFVSLKLAPEVQARVLSALRAREAADRAMPLLTRATGLVCLLCAALELVPRIPATIPYALYLVGYAVAAAVVFMRGPLDRARRMAVLEVRYPEQILRPPVIALCVLTALCSLALVGVPGFTVSALVATAAGLAMVGIAWRTTAAPAHLLGDDLPAERFVDDRIRRIRAGGIATMGGAAPLVLIGAAHLQTVAAAAAFGLAALCTVAAISMILRQPVGAERPVDA